MLWAIIWLWRRLSACAEEDSLNGDRDRRCFIKQLDRMMSTLLVSKVAKTFERIGVATKERGACAECLITLERRGSRMMQKTVHER